MSDDLTQSNLANTHSEKPTNTRWIVLVFVAFASGSAYLTRYCIAVANTTIQEELNFDDSQMGWIMGVFGFGYCACQIPGGWLGNRFGTRKALAGINIVWSLLTVVLASVSSYVPFLLSRIGFGMAQAGLVPISGKIVNDWFPETRRGFSSSVISASMSAGGAITMFLTALLIKELNWRTIFYLYSSVGIMWGIAFYYWFRTHPENHPGVNQEELKLIHSTADETTQTEKINENENPTDKLSGTAVFQGLITSVSFWGICFQALFRAAGYTILVTSFPSLLQYQFGITKTASGIMSTWPLVSVVLGSLVGGILIDYLLTLTKSKIISRTWLAIVAHVLCAAVTLSATWTDSLNLYVTAISAGAFIFGVGNPSCWAASMDIAGRHTATVMAVMNMAGNFGFFLMSVFLGHVIGEIKKTGGDWDLVIYYVVATYFLTAVSWLMINSNRTIKGFGD